MATSKVTYTGELRTQALHLQSGNVIITDAPTDNYGLGQNFSPTDLLATSLASCMLTVMGIASRKENMTPIDGTKTEVTKIMYNEPRRVGEVHITVTFPAGNFSDKEKTIYERTALTCPVAKSLHPDIKQIIQFTWS